MEHTNTNEAMVHTDACACGCAEAAPEVTESQRIESRRSYVPAVDILDAKDTATLVIDVPGTSDAGLDLTVEKNVLTVKAVVESRKHDGKRLIFSEYPIGDYQRSFLLSDDVDKDGIGASLKSGVLTITLPKRQPMTKKIAISN